MVVSPAFNLAKTIVFFTYMMIAVIFKSESVQFFKDLIFFTFFRNDQAYRRQECKRKHYS